MPHNELGQPVGDAVPGWADRPAPDGNGIEGRYCRLEPLNPNRHAAELFRADQRDVSGGSWTYLPYGPFPDLTSYRCWLRDTATGADPLFYTIIDTDSGPPGKQSPAGVLSLLRVKPERGSVEVGHVHYSPLLQRRRAATEAQYLLMHHVFHDLAYRRYEWKCDALNGPSRAAAQRLGFRYEGTFRQAAVVKGRNRDTAWYSITDTEWPRVGAAMRAWLAPENFDDRDRQRTPLRAGKQIS